MWTHCCSISPFPSVKKVGERGFNKNNCLMLYPLILSFSRREKERSLCVLVIQNPEKNQ
jgi:hypothetical protein